MLPPATVFLPPQLASESARTCPRAAALARGSGRGLTLFDVTRARSARPSLDTIETTRKQKIKILHFIKVKRGYCMYCSYCGCDCIVIHQIEGACIDCDLKSPETFKSSTSSRLEDDNDSSSPLSFLNQRNSKHSEEFEKPKGFTVSRQAFGCLDKQQPPSRKRKKE